MLNLKNITKNYVTGDTTVRALDGVDLLFNKCEFVSILGPSGCGKTTLLNIIGGLDRYTQGDLVINGKSTKNFIDAEWDAYRNNSVGFVFQNYNLIPHLNVLENVELALTLSGIKDSERKVKATEALTKVGLSDQLKKRPNQLSGGQMQRVAIARALVNDPDIILADEPTGALDSATSIQIMQLLEKISKERLIIMVTHNSDIADKYSTRIIKLLDGKVVSDNDSNNGVCSSDEEKIFITKKSSMSFLTSLKLSFKNLITKRARTLLTSFAGSIGIIGIALVLAISTGFSKQIDLLQSDSLAAFPLTIQNGLTLASVPSSASYQEMMRGPSDLPEFPESDQIVVYNDNYNINMHLNVFDDDYLNYLSAMDSSLYNSISYNRKVSMNLINKVSSSLYVKVDNKKSGWQEIISNYDFLNSQYDVLEGKLPTNKNQIVIIIDKYNRLTEDTVNALGLPTNNIEDYSFADFIGMELKLIPHDVYYTYDQDSQLYNSTSSLENLYENPLAQTLELVGILRIKPHIISHIMNNGLVYSTELTDYVIQNSRASAVAQAQIANPAIDIFSGGGLTSINYKERMQQLGVDSTPSSISIYPINIVKKEQIKSYLDAYNIDKNQDNKIVYLDIADIITRTMGTIINGITYILVAFAAISLLVSSIMIGIITYISVLERTKEIGVLRSLGARKKDITRVFNAETLIIGFSAGMLGVLISGLLTIPINIIITNLAPELKDIATLRISHALILVVVSMSLTVISGLIPSRLAAKKDPVVALRTE